MDWMLVVPFLVLGWWFPEWRAIACAAVFTICLANFLLGMAQNIAFRRAARRMHKRGCKDPDCSFCHPKDGDISPHEP